ncbi:uncharacterized protein knl1 [Nerophis ophidion]|uniref:uncharacterized protein knl1 n=1 Tax=Nerophis ophidion TaxID=159077 RepID=UPI002ADFE9AF|nr:uncharacterized protein knl1 [Nerophis ophidion]
MEPLDPGKNDENTGFSNRHIFSILKAPRKSIRFPDSEQQENQVESAKPVERRNSRRVSFAPANDVLLFSNDVKKSSSGRSPLQELMTTVPTQNRVQVTSEDEIQQIMGMETLLNAPLHGSDQKEKANSDTGFGEKTMIYCDDDGFLDLTQSHTINIAFCEDDLFGAPQKTGSNFLSSGKSTADCVSSDINPRHTFNMARGFEFPPDGRNTGFSQSVPSCGPSLTHSLPSLSKPTALKMKPSNATVNPSLSQTKTQKANVDKENHVPSFFRNAGNVRESSCGSTLCQDEDVNMDVTHTGRVTGLTADDDDDPFQGLFPTKEMYSQSDRGSQQSQNQENPQKQATATPKASEDRYVFCTSHIGFSFTLVDIVEQLGITVCQRVKAEEDCREKTVRFTAEDMCMDITKSNTGKITTDLSDPPNLAIFGSNRKAVSSMEKRHRDTIGMSSCAMNLNPGLQNVLRTSKPKDISINARYSGLAYPLLTKAPSTRDLDFPEDELSMDMTEVQTGLIIESTGNVDPINCLRLAQEMHSNSGQTATQQLCTDKRKSSCNTAKETSLNAPLRHQASCDTQEDCREKTIKFTADGEVMHVTKSHTVNMACFLPMQSHKSLPTNKERTIRFSVNDADMDVTQSHTANIALVEPEEYHYVDLLPAGEDKTIDAALQQTHSQTANIANSLRTGAHHNCDVAAAGKDRTLRSTADDASVDVTRCHTIRIDTPFEPSAHNVDVLPAAGEKTMRCTAMNETQSHTAYVANYLEQGAHHNVNFVPAGRETTLMFTADDDAMDETQSHTSKIGHFLKTGAHHNFDIVPAGKDRTVRFTAEDASMDVTRCHTGRIDTPFEPSAHNVDVLPAAGEKTMRCTAMDETQSHTAYVANYLEQGAHHNVNFVPAGRETTLMFTADDAAMDETQSHTSKIGHFLKTGAHHNFDIVPAGKDRTVRFTAEDASMDVTRCHTGRIVTPFDPRAHNVDILPATGKKTMRCTAMDAALEETRSHTANIATHLESGAHLDTFVPAEREKTLTFTRDAALMDETQSHIADVANYLKTGPHHNCYIVPSGKDRTVRFTADDASMDVTRSHTVKIETPFEKRAQNVDILSVEGEKTMRCTAMDAALEVTRCHTANMATHLEPGADPIVNFLPAGGEKTVRFIADDAAMDVTKCHTVQIDTPFEREVQNFLCVPAKGEKTLRFTADDAAMDVTKCHTIQIDTPFEREVQNVLCVPAIGEKTLRFTADDAAMDVTKCHTVQIDTPFEREVQNVLCVPAKGEKTLRFTADDAAMDVTKCHTIQIDTPFEREVQNVLCVPAIGEKTLRFTADDAAMDVTKCHTVQIDTPFEREVQNVLCVPAKGEKTLRFTADDAAMDVTKCHTVQIDTPFEREVQNVLCVPAKGEKTLRFTADDAAMDVTKCHTVKIETPFEREVQNVLCVPAKGEKTLRFTADDAAMDVTKCHTVKIETPFELDVHNDDCVLVGGEKTTRLSADDVSLDGTQSHTHIATHLDSGADLNVNFVPAGADKPLRFTADDAAMNVTKGHTVKMYTPFELQAHNVDCVPVVEEKTTRFSAENISLGGTQIHTPDIATCLKQGANLDNFEPVGREKTLMFTADDASMDVTRCHTLRINTPFELKVKNVNCVPVGKEKTTRFSADDDTLDETKRQTPDIAAHFEQRAHYGNFVPVGGDKTFRFTADDAAMDVKKCHTVKIDTPFDLEVKNVDFVPVGGEKTTRLSTDDASLDGTQGYSANIASTFEPQNKTNVDTWPAGEEKILGFSADDAATDEQQRPAINTSYSNEDSPTKNRDEIKHPPKNGSSPVLPIHTGLRRANPIVTKDECLSESSSRKTGDTDHFILTQHKTPCIVNKTRVPTLLDNSVSDAKNMQCSLQRVETDASMDVTKAQTGSIVGEKYSNGNEHSSSQLSTQDPDGGVQKIRRATSPQPNQELGLSKQDAVEIANVAYSVYSDETDIRNVSELGHITSPLLANFNLASAVGHDSTSKKSRRKSFADLQLKVRHLSRLINMTPETPAMESCTAPLPHMDPGINTNPKNNDLLPIEVPDVIGEMGNTEGEAQDLPLEYATAETPFKLKNLMSRLSMGDFKPKLPQKNRVDDSKKSDSSHMNSERKSDPTTNNIANDMGNWKDDVSDIYDEELGRCEDLLGTLDTSGSPKMTANVIPVEECYISQNLRDDVFKEENPNCAPGIKRRLPSDEGHTEEEKKLKMSPEMVPETVKMTMDSSSTTHTSSSRGEVTFNSTFKQSMFESQLEDYSSDVQRKLEDGTITVSEFFKLFNIDFVIHKPRQSILRGRPSSDTDRTPIDVMKDRLINRPKERVYEADIKSLTEKVEGLSYRMCDLNKPLKMINTALWEEMKNSSEKEIKSFGVKLKERNNYFRKMSRVRSHEMKEVLYTGVVQALTDEQQNLRSSVEKSEETVKMLNDCIRDLEAELAAIEDKGTDTKPSLKSLQEELKKVNESMDENERQICDLETQKNQASSKLKSLKADTKNLESSIAILNMLNEWRLKEKRGNYTVYTFLNDTLHLQLVYKGNGTAEEPEQETSEINFTFLLDDTSSQCHARLVHKLISQYIYGQTLWVKKYPTSNHVQKLLYDVSLVVSHCRLLGEEIRLLKMWGGLRLKILDISCEDTRIHIVFSSLRRCSKFEVSFSVSLDKHIYGLHVHSFRNIFGDATIQQIVSIVKSFVPARKLLTKIVKKIHADLLSSAEYVQSTTEVFNK